MFKYKVLNVGQGDCIGILNLVKRCKYKNYKIITDLGDGSRDIFKEFIKQNTKLILCLTHSHKDHIGGLKYLDDYKDYVKEIWLPAYYQEIIKIAKILLSLKGSKDIDNEDINKCKNSIEIYNILVKANKKIKIKFVYEGINICSHIKILNPPLNINNIFDIKDKKFEKKILSDDYDDIKDWFENIEIFIKILNNDDFIQYDIPKDLKEYNKIKRKEFFVKFLNYLKEDIDNYLISSNNMNFSNIYTKSKLSTNDCSIVNTFSYTKEKEKICDSLFTGDASIKIFDRLMKNNKLKKVNILKVPHHGSKHNLNENIVNTLNPNFAIISHNNHKFGTSIDGHPNIEIIDILTKNRIKTLYTNDVIKSAPAYNIKCPTSSCLFCNNISYIK